MDDPILTIEEREAINSGRWFSSLSPSLRHDILRCAYVKRFKDGGLIAARGDPPEEWIACARGAVRVSSTSISGKQITLTYVEPGIWFGDVAIFDGDRRTHDAYAHGDTTILCVAKADFKKILAAHTEFYEAMLRLHARRIRQLYGLVEDLNTLPCGRAWPSSSCTWCAAMAFPVCRTAARCALACNWPRKSWRNCWGIAPAGEPGTQSHGTRGCDSHRAGWPGGAQPRSSDAHCRSRHLKVHFRSPPCSPCANPAHPTPAHLQRQARPSHITARGALHVRKALSRLHTQPHMSNFDHFVGTRPVSEQHAFDVAALTSWLGRHMPGFEGPLTVEMFKGGQSNPTYKLITPSASYVMRAKPGPVAKLLPSAHAIEREFAVMSGLQGTDVPVPRMHVLCEDESVIGRAFYVMECMQAACCGTNPCPA